MACIITAVTVPRIQWRLRLPHPGFGWHHGVYYSHSKFVRCADTPASPDLVADTGLNFNLDQLFSNVTHNGNGVELATFTAESSESGFNYNYLATVDWELARQPLPSYPTGATITPSTAIMPTRPLAQTAYDCDRHRKRIRGLSRIRKLFVIYDCRYCHRRRFNVTPAPVAIDGMKTATMSRLCGSATATRQPFRPIIRCRWAA